MDAIKIEGIKAEPTVPRLGDLFTHDFSSFFEVRDINRLQAHGGSLVLHIVPGVNWKAALRGYLRDNPRILLWEANGTPALVSLSD